MDVDAQSLYRSLNKNADDINNGPSECFRLLSTLNYNLTEEQIDSTVIDSYLLYMFDQSNGIVPFILKVASKKEFKDAVIKSFEIIYTLINNFPKLLERYILAVNELCLNVNQSNANYEEKIKALEVLCISFEKVDKCLENQEQYLRIFEGLTNALSVGHSDTVKHREMMALGLFSKKFNYIIHDPASIKNYFIVTLDRDMVQNKSQHIICGVFTGLTYYCESFPFSSDNDSDRPIIEKLYKHIKELSIPKARIKIGNRAAMAFLTANMDLFIPKVLPEFKAWHGVLLSWLKMGAEELKTGVSTLKAYFVTISKALEQMPTDECTTKLNHYIGWCKSTLSKEISTSQEKRLAIHCLKSFSKCCYKHMSNIESNELFLDIMENFEKSYILNQDPTNENWEFLPDFIQCVASFMRQNDAPGYLFCLQRAMVNMIRTFHELETLHHGFVIDAIVQVLFYLKGNKHFESFVESVIYHGVVWSCSHQHISATDLIDNSRKIITVKNYFPLWISVLKLQSNRSYDKYGIYLEARRLILTAVVNYFIKSLMVLINKLNVDVEVKQQEEYVTDIENMYKVSKIDDYAIFLNVVDFYKEILNHIEPSMFERCISKLISHLINKCVKCPFISGFYTLLSFMLKIANNLKLLENENITLNQDVQNCRNTLTKFFDMLLHKMKQFKDELLISCLHVLLQMPTCIVQQFLNDCGEIFRTIFEMGRSNISLAHTGLDTLEHWQEKLPKEDFEPFLVKVIPSLDPYIRSKSLGGLMQSAVIERRIKTSRALKKRKVIVELEPELVKFQQKVLRFIGNQNSKVCLAFVSSDNNVTSAIMGENLHLKISFPYDDMNLDVYLEPFVPRLVDLALNCSDRKSRITACELLQATVIVFLGKTKPMTDAGLSELDSLLKCISTPLLHLSCDFDEIVRQIFEPLFLQMIHWYTSNFQTRSGHAAIIIETIMEGITHPTNSSIRDFSGKCINEYVRWTIKQTGEARLADDPVNIKILIKKMRFFSSHPDLSKKLGAALIFNNMYREIREEDALVSIFWVEILDIFVESLAMIEKDDLDTEATTSEINKALQHWKRVFLSKCHLFRKVDLKRRLPKTVENGSVISIAENILKKSCSRSKCCREATMDLFENLTELEDVKINIVPHTMYEEWLKKYATLSDVKNTGDCSILVKWLQALLCAIDGCVFLTKNKLLTVFDEESYTFKGVTYFLENVQSVSFEEALNLISRTSWLFTSIDKEYFNNLKASCNSAILQLAYILGTRVNNVNLYSENFYNLIVNATFHPQVLGFDLKIEKSKHLDLVDKILLYMVRAKLKDKISSLVNIIHAYIKDNWLISVDIMRSAKLKQRNLINGLLFLYNSQINEKYICLTRYKTGLVNSLLMNFYENVEGKIIIVNDLQQTVTDYCTSILKLALNDYSEFRALLSHFFNGYTVRSASSEYQKEVPVGIYLLNNFGDIIVDKIMNNFDEVTEICLKETNGIDYIIYILNVVLKEKRFNSEGVTSKLLQNWEKLERIFDENASKNQMGLEFISLLQCLDMKHAPAGILRWLMKLLTTENDEEFQINAFLVIIGFTDDENSDINGEERIALQTFSSHIHTLSTTKPILTEKVLSAIPFCKSITGLQYLLNIYVQTDIEVEVVSNFSKFIRTTSKTLQQEALNLAYNFITKENLEEKRKLKVADDILTPLLQGCNFAIFEQFYVENISNIIQGLSLDDYISKAVHFVLVEILFSRISVGSLERKDCPIIEGSGNKKLRAMLVKNALDILKSQNRDETARILKCKAYKALASIFTNCEDMKKEAFFEKLFYRAENNDDVLWSGLIDTSVSYNFAVEFDSLPKQRKILVNIRKELRQKDSQLSQRYIESQKLFNSSLSEDITKYDFTNATLRQNNIENGNEVSFVGHTEIDLDSTEINNHECMATICGVIRYIFESGINDLPKDDEDDTIELPLWMEGVRKVLLSENTHKNIKIFLVKVIENMEHIFRHFAKFFIGPLLKFVSEKCAGDSINYFITDVLVTISSWAEHVTPDNDNKSYISEVLSFLIEKLNNDRQDMFKYNLDLIKLMIENWKEHIDVPYEQLITKFHYDVNDRKIEVGIHLSSLFLANNLPVCTNINNYWQKLLKTMTSTARSIYRPCAETVGLFLRYLDVNLIENNCQQEIDRFVKQLEDIDKYAFTLEGIAIHYSKFISNFHIARMINRLRQSPKHLKILFLKVLNKSTDHVYEIVDFKRENWGIFVENDNLEIQLITLEIILNTLDILKDSTVFANILKSASKMLQSPNALSRSLTYDIFISVLNKDICKENDRSLCKDVLIQGLVDPDYENREKVRMFWTEHQEIPSQITHKFCYLLSELYTPKTEDHFLGYASYFLLNSLIDDEDKDVRLFENPLEDCDFEEYKLQLNWRLRHPSEVPLFAETLRTFQDDLEPYSESSFNQLRNTQASLNFTPTQSMRNQQISKLTNISSSLLVDESGDGFKNPNDLRISQKYKLPKRRFLKDRTKMSAQFAHYEVKKQLKKVERRYDAVREGEQKVTIYRNYRKGDFPDVEINLSAVVRPLQMLALFDGEISKLLFSAIFKSLSSKVENNRELLDSVLDSIKNIFTNSTQFNSNLFSTLLDILLKNSTTVKFDPQLLSTVCQQSGLMSIGALLLEEYIILNSDDGRPPTKKGSATQNDETILWLKLAELYRETEQWDLVRTVFIEKIQCDENVQLAIGHESNKRWRQAQECYQNLIETDISVERRDFYYESYFKCLAHLGEWNALPRAISSIVPNAATWENLWDKDWYQQKLLPWYVVSHVRHGLFTNDIDHGFLKDLNSSYLKTEQNEYLRSKFSEELCTLWLFKRDEGQASQYLSNSLQNFLSEWQLINPMFESLRYNKLLRLGNVIEVDKFLHVQSSINDESGPMLKQLQNYWKDTQPEFLPSILLSEAKLLYRRLFISLLIEKVAKLRLTEIEQDLRRTKILLDISFMKVAIEDENYYMARKYYKEYEELNSFSLSMIFGNIAYLKSKLSHTPRDQFAILLTSCQIFANLSESSNDKTQIQEANIKCFDACLKISEILTLNEEIFHSNAHDIREVFGDVNSAQDIPFKVLEQLRHYLINDTFDDHMDCDVNNKKKNSKTETTAKAFVKLAYFVRDNKKYTQDFILYVLRAMNLGSKEARQLFPCILLEEQLGNDFKEVFLKESGTVPTWMFLGWIPQLLANLDSSKIGALSKIIMRIAETYPQSIMYAYRLSKENYKDLSDVEQQSLIEKLDAMLLSDASIEIFLKALSFVTVPVVAIRYYVQKMFHCKDNDEILLIQQKVLKEFFQECPDSKDLHSLQGNMFKKTSKLNVRFSKFQEYGIEKIKDELRKMDAELKKILENKNEKFSGLLQDYCPWLAHFSTNIDDFEIEIPGQYTGEKMPLVQHHVKISGFLPNVRVMSSIRKPIKVIMLGMNSREYPFLIKFGEDIRQDQRIQQLFTLMNNIFVSDNQELSLLTYQVIPLTSNLGVIEWIDHTTPLMDFVRKCIKDRKVLKNFESAPDKYVGFLSAGKTPMHEYGLTAVKKDRSKLVPFFQGIVNSVPLDILKKSFWTLGTTTEDFIALRSNFIKSYAVLCACHWLVGIGDRHLSNSLICIKNGKVLGIDFGHAFGTGTQIQAVPELVPFRLTPRILGLMEPFKERGTFRDVMVAALRSLRSNSSSLLATMDVFIQEPSIDWLENATKSETASDGTAHEWYPKAKIDQAKRKLSGASSTEIMVEDLTAGRKVPQYTEALIRHVRGSAEHNQRARLNVGSCLTVEQQVDCLIDHAVDYNLLGRMFVGWYPWI